MELNIDKSLWKKVQFGDVVQKVLNKINPESYHSEIIIKGGHINKRDFHIRNFENKNELGYLGPSFHMGFKKNQILYVSRNPHLMKVGYPHFDGICANTTFVMETKDSGLLRNDLIPFIMHSDTFIEQSVANVRGGVNPYVNWSDLASIEFLLPPTNQQNHLSKLLWSIDDLIEKDLELRENLKLTLESNIESEIHGIKLKNKVISDVLDDLSKRHDTCFLSELGDFYKGKGIPKSVLIDRGIPCVRYGELYTNHNRVIRKFNSFIPLEEKGNSILLKKNDALFAGSGETITEIGKSAVFIDDIEAYAGGDVLIFRPFNMDGLYLGYLLNSLLVRYQLNKLGKGSTVMHIYNSDLKKIKVPKIKIEEQIRVGKKLESIQRSIIKLEGKISDARLFKNGLINKVF